MTLEEIVAEVSKIKGWFSASEMAALYPYVKPLFPNRLLVELGTYAGRSTLFFRLAAPPIRIITIDICKKVWTDESIAVEKIWPQVVAHGNIFAVEGDSAEIFPKFTLPIDFLFIDRRHTYPETKIDIETWGSLVKVGGMIGFHDYNPGFPGVVQLVDELAKDPRFSLLTAVNGVAVLLKNS